MTLFALVENRPGFRKQSTKTWEGPCPKCGGTTRLIVWINTNIFKCRECDFKGDTFKWLRGIEGYSCREAHVALDKVCETTTCDYYAKCSGDTTPRRRKPGSAHPPRRKGSDQWQPREAKAPEVLWQRKARELVDWAHEQLLASPERLAYLADRGLPLAAVKKYRLGWNPGQDSKGKPGPLFKQRAAWGLPEKNNAEGNAIKAFPIQRGFIIPSFMGDDIYRLRIRRPDEDLAAYTGPDDQKPAKYLFVEGSGKGLVIRDTAARAFVIVESDFDDLLLDFVAGDVICSVPLTSCGIRPDAESAPVLAKAAIILNALDYDPRENKQTGRYESPGGQAARWWAKHFSNSERWPPPVGKDPGDAFKEGVDLRQWIIDGLPLSLQPPWAERTERVERKAEAVPVEFDEKKAWQQIKDTRSRISSAYPAGAYEWLKENHPKGYQWLKGAEAAAEKAFAERNQAELDKILPQWEDQSLKAWKLFEARPPVIDIENDVRGETHVI